VDEEGKKNNIIWAVRLGIIDPFQGLRAYKAIEEGNYEVIKELYAERTNQDGHGTT
jgi:hypothetical protein